MTVRSLSARLATVGLLVAAVLAPTPAAASPAGDARPVAGGADAAPPTVTGTAPTATVAPPEFSAGSPPQPVLGKPYSYRFAMAAGSPATFSVTAGQLPRGLSLSADGVLAGTPASSTFAQFVVTATNAGGSSDDPVALQATFTDVAPAGTFRADIYWLADRQITVGYADGRFGSTLPITRGAFAAFLYRYTHRGQDAGDCGLAPVPFPDVPARSPFCGDIAWLADQGITQGDQWGRFDPGQRISRQAMAAFLYRMHHHDDAGPCAGSAPFRDVARTSIFCGSIAWLTRTEPEPIVAGYTDGTFRPTAAVSRQAMAAFLHRYDADFPGAGNTATPKAATTVVTDPSTVVSVSGSPDGTQQVVLGADSSAFPEINGYLVAPAGTAVPNGVLIKVTDVQWNDNGSVTVTGAPGLLDEAFSDVDIRGTADGALAAASVGAGAVAAGRPGGVSDGTTSSTVFAADTCEGDSDATVNASVDFSRHRFYASLVMATRSFTMGGFVQPSVTINATFHGEKTCTLRLDRDITIPLSTVPPLALVLEPTLIVHASGTLEATATYAPQASVLITESPTSHYRRFSITDASPSLQASGEAILTVTLSMNAELALAGRVGIGGGIAPTLTLDSSIRADTEGDLQSCIDLTGQVDMSLTASMDLWIKDWSWTLLSGTFGKHRMYHRCYTPPLGTPPGGGTGGPTVHDPGAGGSGGGGTGTPPRPPAIVTVSLPGGAKIAKPYHATLQATGGSTPYQWVRWAGSLPPGLAIDPITGTVDGIPKVSGTYSFTVTVTTPDDMSDSRDYTITVTGYTVKTVLGDGAPCVGWYYGMAGMCLRTGVPALQTSLGSPDGHGYLSTSPDDMQAMALAPDGTLYLWNSGRVFRRAPGANGLFQAVTGLPDLAVPTDAAPCRTNVPATKLVVQAYAMAVDPAGNLYVADAFNNLVYRITPGGTAAIVAGLAADCGGESHLDSGDGGPATSAHLRQPHSLAIAPNGTIYISTLGVEQCDDLGECRYPGGGVRAIAPGGTISTVLTTDELPDRGYNGDGHAPHGTLLAADASGLYVFSTSRSGSRACVAPAEGGHGVCPWEPGFLAICVPQYGPWCYGPLVRMTSPHQIVSVQCAGGGACAGPMIEPEGWFDYGYPTYYNVRAISLAANGDMVVATRNGVWKLAPSTGFDSGIPSPGPVLIAGTSDRSSGGGIGGEAGPAAAARFDGISSLAAAPDGSVFVYDTGNRRVRQLTPPA